MKENKLLYFIEAIACFFVIFIHCDMNNLLGNILETIGRFAVPLFFIISGYFNYNSNKQKIKCKVRKQMIIFMISFVFYWLYVNIENYLVLKNDIIEFNLSLFSMTNILKLVFFNWTSFISSHLWYILALIYCYIFIIIFKKKFIINNVKFIICLPIFSYVVNIIVAMLFKIEDNFYFRNWLFIGIPFFTIGYYIRGNKEKFKSIKTNTIINMMIIGVILTMIERVVLKLCLNAMFHFYLGSYLLSVSIFIFAIKNENVNIKLTYIGKYLSLYIYLIHYVFIKIMKNILPYYGVNINDYLITILTIILSVITSYFINRITLLIKNKKQLVA